MSYQLFKVLHLLGIFLLFAAVGGAALRAAARPGGVPKDSAARLAGITHGVALLILLVTGFGILGVLGLGLPGWAWAKAAIWLVMGALPMLIRRAPRLAPLIWWLLPALGLIAAWLAVYKPF